MKKNMTLKLKCGVEVEYRKNKDVERISVSLIDLYNGYGSLNSFSLLAKLFAELDELGYEGTGLYREMGYYDSVDDIILEVMKDVKKKK